MCQELLGCLNALFRFFQQLSSDRLTTRGTVEYFKNDLLINDLLCPAVLPQLPSLGLYDMKQTLHWFCFVKQYYKVQIFWEIKSLKRYIFIILKIPQKRHLKAHKTHFGALFLIPGIFLLKFIQFLKKHQFSSWVIKSYLHLLAIKKL